MPEWAIEAAADAQSVAPSWLEDIAAAVRFTLERESVGDAELSFALVSDQRIAEINEQYLSHEGPTDVISFPLVEPGLPLAGDVYIGLAQAERQAREHGVEVREEVLRLAIHGTLHVLGWDHPEDDTRTGSPMYVRQEQLLTSFLSRS